MIAKAQFRPLDRDETVCKDGRSNVIPRPSLVFEASHETIMERGFPSAKTSLPPIHVQKDLFVFRTSYTTGTRRRRGRRERGAGDIGIRARGTTFEKASRVVLRGSGYARGFAMMIARGVACVTPRGSSDSPLRCSPPPPTPGP
ncbi:hypothetical protein KM043_000729 [Ampulex compressa]|nr:hypothetical protein KM043_000729 [Ampulex compressa]